MTSRPDTSPDTRFLPGASAYAVVARAPAAGPQHWAGAPSAVLEPDGTFVLSYRRRDGAGIDALVIARSLDGVDFETTAELLPESAGAAMTERASLLRIGSAQWRMYSSFATPDSLHWWVGMADATSPEALTTAPVVPLFTGDRETIGFKDPVVTLTGGEWRAYLCGHALDRPGQEDRMVTHLARSHNGIAWSEPVPVLAGRPGAWDARGARVTAALPGGSFSYDGRASAEENWFEKTGLAGGEPDGPLAALDVEPLPLTRYLDVLALPDGGYRIYYETTLPDESHELRTELVPSHPGGR